ncbi:hypothetical protein [Nocardia concava]|uniref:hypothetical protein n=1 Tax=Nocardia concava TaxID=257281 RepID=UPI0012FA31D4|nr:hypothetical protein [Nocardia concava]
MNTWRPNTPPVPPEHDLGGCEQCGSPFTVVISRPDCDEELQCTACGFVKPLTCEELDCDWTEWSRKGYCPRCGTMLIEAIDWNPEEWDPTL